MEHLDSCWDNLSNDDYLFAKKWLHDQYAWQVQEKAPVGSGGDFGGSRYSNY
jgi:hypothetical protein